MNYTKFFLLFVFITLFGFGCSGNPLPKTQAQIEAEKMQTMPNYLMIENQSQGQTVKVLESKFEKPGFLAVHEQNEDATIGTMIGYSNTIPNGYKQHIKIATTLLLEIGEWYVIRMYDDTNGDTFFDPDDDNIIYESGSETPVQKTFQVVE